MENKLELIVKESGLEKSKAQVLLTNFSNYFEIAAEWEKKASELVVTDESQTTLMKMAKEARLFLKQKRVAIENTRKELKEQSLREGQTIDAIAKILKNLIEPIEGHFEKQEKFAEIREDDRKQARMIERNEILSSLNYDYSFTDTKNMSDQQFDLLVKGIKSQIQEKIEAERKAEEERIAREKAEQEERERIRIENEKLKAEAEEKERQLQKEREESAKREAELKARQEQELEKQREEARIEAEKQAKIRAEQQASIEAERKEKERIEAELKSKREAELKAEADKLASEKKAASAPDKQKLIALADTFKQVVIPSLKTSEAVAITAQIAELQRRLVDFIITKSNTL